MGGIGSGIARVTAALMLAMCPAAAAVADDLPSAFTVDHVDWMDRGSVRGALAGLIGRPGPVMFADTAFDGKLLQAEDGQYQAAFVRRTPPADDFKDRFLSVALNMWGAPAEEGNGSPDDLTEGVTYQARWEIGGTAVRLTLRQVNTPFLKVDFCSLTFQSSRTSSEQPPKGFIESIQGEKELGVVTDYIKNNPEDKAALEYRAKLYYRAGDLEQAWKDVAVIMKEGGKIDKDFESRLNYKSLTAPESAAFP